MRLRGSSVAIAALMGAGSIASAQSVAQVLLGVSETTFLPGGGVEHEILVFANALEGQIGNNSGVNGFNLRFDVFRGEITSVEGNAEIFGNLNLFTDANGFDVSGSSNSFAGNNFSDGLPLLTLRGTFEVELGLLANQTSGIFTSQGTISLFNALTGLPGAFQPSVGYDTVIFGSIGVPSPGAFATLAVTGLVAGRRRRSH